MFDDVRWANLLWVFNQLFGGVKDDGASNLEKRVFKGGAGGESVFDSVREGVKDDGASNLQTTMEEKGGRGEVHSISDKPSIVTHTPRRRLGLELA